MNPATQKNQNQKRFEWSALFAVAFLLVALAPQSLGAHALNPSLAFSSHVVPQFALAQFQAQSLAVQNAASSFLASRSVARPAVSASTQFHLKEQRGISTSQFGRTYSQPAVTIPAFPLCHTHAAHHFGAALPAHVSAFLSGTRTNHFDE